MASTPSLLGLLSSASTQTLADIDKEIASRTEELAQHTTRLGSEIASLTQLRKLIDVKLNGKKPRAKAVRKPKEVTPGSILDRVYTLLSKAAKPMTASEIAGELRCSLPPVYEAIKHEWFVKIGTGVTIARTGVKRADRSDDD